MNPTELKALPILKTRSKSMPIINSFHHSAQLPKLQVIKPKPQDASGQPAERNHKIFEIQNLKDKQKEQLNTKLKVLAERSAKKLQYKYQTIDRWKQKYVPQSSLFLIKHKLSLDHHSTPTGSESIAIGKRENELKLKGSPILGQGKTGADNYKQQGRKLQQLLRTRLQRNKKYYQLNKTILERQIVCFDHMNIFISPQKKRELELKALLLQSQKQEARNRGLLFQKMCLAPLSDRKQKKKQSIKRIKRHAKQGQTISKDSSPPDIQNFKSKLMEQVVSTTPEGWDTINQPQSPEDQNLM